MLDSNRDRPEITISIANLPVQLNIDTMVSINVLDEVTFKLIKPQPKLKPHKVPAFPYGTNKPIKFLGEFLASVKVANKQLRAFSSWQRVTTVVY